MQTLFIEYVSLILIILALVMFANKLRIAYPIVLVVGGLILSYFPAFSNVKIEPDLVFFIFLPPLLYESAWQTSWKEFWKWRRVIASFAFPIVILTSCVVAFVSQALIPGFTLALGFLLGGIISPPDAISATTIMRQLKVPKRLLSIIEGESLMNDASSLIVFRFALAAVITGQFHWQAAANSFFWVIVMGTLIGLAIGFVFYAIHKWLPTTPSIEVVLTFLTPYFMYYAAEHFHFSGVLAVVSGGLLLSSKRQSMLTYLSRLQSTNVWSSLVFVLNGLVFLLIGLQLPTVVQQLGDTSIVTAVGYGLAISFVLTLCRIICTLGASLFTRFMSHFIKVADPNPGWRLPVIFGWAGMRGVVSLASALAIPLYIQEGQAFPNRNLILFITFIVILVTLVFQGLTLPWLIKKLKIKDNATPEKEQEVSIQHKMAQNSLAYLEDKYGKNCLQNEHISNLYERLTIELSFLSQAIETRETSHGFTIKKNQTIYLELLEQQRILLNEINHLDEFDEELIRKYHTLIDIEEYKIREKAIL